jgi:hypothetical protein
MFDSSKIFFTAILIFVSAASIYSQKIPSLLYDESNGQIKAFFYLDKEDEQGCYKDTPQVGIVSEFTLGDDISYLTIKIGKNKSQFQNIELGHFPAHLLENLKSFLLIKGSQIKVWTQSCGNAPIVFAYHIAKVENGRVVQNPPVIKDSVIEKNPNDAIQELLKVENEINKKITQIKTNFDKEIAPNISSGEKGEFETTSEAKARLNKLQQLRAANSSTLWKRIYIETNSLVNEYLKLVASFYAIPVRANLGRYDADGELFPLFIENKDEIKIKVPRSIAPKLKQNFSKAVVFEDFSIDKPYADSTGKFTGRWDSISERTRIEFEGQTFYDEYW